MPLYSWHVFSHINNSKFQLVPAQRRNRPSLQAGGGGGGSSKLTVIGFCFQFHATPPADGYFDLITRAQNFRNILTTEL